jgi:hypothetical protein
VINGEQRLALEVNDTPNILYGDWIKVERKKNPITVELMGYLRGYNYNNMPNLVLLTWKDISICKSKFKMKIWTHKFCLTKKLQYV